MSQALDQLIDRVLRSLDITSFIAATTLDDRVDVVLRAAPMRLYSHQLAEVWAGLIAQHSASLGAPLVRALVREMLQLSPHHDRAESVYRAIMSPQDALLDAAEPVFMIASCERYLDKARGLRQQLQALGARALILTGQASLLDTEWHDEGLTVPVADTYEALPLKVATGIAAIVGRFGPCTVVKIDDDCQPTADFKVSRFMQLGTQHDYVGVPIQDPCHDRLWHHGKTSRPMGAYTRRYLGPWARGACYLLGQRASAQIAREVTFFPGEFSCEYYEDKAVGDCLRRHDIALSSLPGDAAWGITFDMTERPVSARSQAQAPSVQSGESPAPAVASASTDASRARIPKVLHLTWVGDDSRRPNNCIQTWIDQNPTWTVKVWGNEDLAQQEWVNARHIKEMWNRELNGVADLMRWEILYNEGGIVVDADSVCVRPLDDWILEADAIACWENEITRPRLIGCNMIGAVPQNPFIGQIIQDLHQLPTVIHDMAWKTVGPLCITQAYFKYRYTGLTILPSHFFIPDHFSGVHYQGSGIVYAKQEWASTHQSYDTLHLKNVA